MSNGTMLPRNCFAFAGLLVAALLAAPACAHPHVTVEANLEIVRNVAGEVIELRHVWRFDELFSSTVLLDYDKNANNALEPDELAEVSKTVTLSLSEQDYYTQVRLGSEDVDFVPPEKIMVDYVDGQVLMFFSAGFAAPVKTSGEPFKVSVSDPTYYVAMEISDEAAVQVSGQGAACKVVISVPDFDKLMSQNQATLTEQYFNDPKNDGLGDDWLTWVTLTCK